MSAETTPRIYRVELTYQVYVFAESEREAIDWARFNERHEEPENEHAKPINSTSEVDREWLHCLPYGSGHLTAGERTISAILREQEQAARGEEVGE